MPGHASEHAAELIRMEYPEFPGLRLTFRQAQRLWNLKEDECRDGAYVRAASSAFEPCLCIR